MSAPKSEGIESGEGNGRVTLAKIGGDIALLANRIDTLIETMKDCKTAINSQEDQIHNNGIRITRLETKFEDIDTLKKAVIGNIVAVVITAVAAILALINGIP